MVPQKLSLLSASNTCGVLPSVTMLTAALVLKPYKLTREEFWTCTMFFWHDSVFKQV